MSDPSYRRCYGLNPEGFELIFEDEEEAKRNIGDNFRPFNVGRYHYFLSEYATYGGREGRALAECMYRCLYEPTNFNSNRAHTEKKLFGHVDVGREGIFLTRRGITDTRLIGMPTVGEMYDSLRDQGLFDFRMHAQRPLWNLLSEVLSKKIDDVDKRLVEILREYNS